MDALAEKLDTKLRTWQPETAAQVRQRVAEVIDLADEDVLDVLDDLMRSHGFDYIPTAVGVGSGGSFATGEFRRGSRTIELHYRDSLGLVTYRVGDLLLSREDYMWSILGERWRSQYPGFSKEPLDGFRRLRADWENHCFEFFGGSDADFASRAQQAEYLKKAASRLP